MAAAATLFAALVLLQADQARRTVLLEPVDGPAAGKEANDIWVRDGVRHLAPVLPRKFLDELYMPGPDNTGINKRCPVLSADLPYARDGYVLNIGVTRADNEHPPLLEVAVNDIVLASEQVPYARLGETSPFHSVEIQVPPDRLKAGNNRLTVRSVAGMVWLGHLALIPGLALRTVLPILLPISAWGLLGLVLIRGTRDRLPRGFPAILALVCFAVFWSSRYVRSAAPVTGFFFSDAPDFLDPILHKNFNFDMVKHPLFLPVIRMFYKTAKAVLGGHVPALGAAFALVGAFNAAVALQWMRRWLGDGRLAGFVGIVHAFSFSVWAYSATYETYVLSSLSANLFLLVLFFLRPLDGWRRIAGASLALVPAILLHPPLGILGGVLAVVTFRDCARWRTALVRVAAAGGLTLILSVAGQRAIFARWESRVVEMPQFRLPEGQRFASWDAQVNGVRAPFLAYANKQYMTFHNLGNIVAGQCVHSVVGQAYPFNWSLGWPGLGQAFRSKAARPALAGMGLVLLLGLAGLVRQPALLRVSAAAALLSGLPYFAFFWQFNPQEMLLYSSPMLAIYLGWLARAPAATWPRLTATAWAVWSLLVVVANAFAMRTYV